MIPVSKKPIIGDILNLIKIALIIMANKNIMRKLLSNSKSIY
jgi:hypothetical protein